MGDHEGSPDLSLIIPCFNEADNVQVLRSELRPIIDRLRQERSVEVILVNDGSSDGTGAMLEGLAREWLATRVVHHPRNRGLGAALRTGFAAARGAVLVCTDSDATYPFSLIAPLLAHLRPEIDIVTASCYHPAGAISDVPAYRVLLSRGASWLYRALVDRRIHTYTCMFRAYRRHVIETVPFEADGFLSVTEVLVRARLQGYTVAEFPCTLRVRRFGTSKARIARIIRSHLAFQWWIARGLIRRWRAADARRALSGD
jgi:dolichol-phosphate mannosyltransferase